MKKIDVKHVLFHVLVAVYTLWVVVYGVLLAITLDNALTNADTTLSRVFMIWIFLNLLMGTVLFIVITLFRNRTVINKFILYSYFIMAGASVATVLIVNSGT